jgi:DNA repair exonuclease SbcCD ATPase subunit
VHAELQRAYTAIEEELEALSTGRPSSPVVHESVVSANAKVQRRNREHDRVVADLQTESERQRCENEELKRQVESTRKSLSTLQDERTKGLLELRSELQQAREETSMLRAKLGRLEEVHVALRGHVQAGDAGAANAQQQVC